MGGEEHKAERPLSPGSECGGARVPNSLAEAKAGFWEEKPGLNPAGASQVARWGRRPRRQMQRCGRAREHTRCHDRRAVCDRQTRSLEGSRRASTKWDGSVHTSTRAGLPARYLRTSSPRVLNRVHCAPSSQAWACDTELSHRDAPRSLPRD